MSDVLKEMLGDVTDTMFKDPKKLIEKVFELEKRVAELEKKNQYGGVYIDGSPKIVKDYWKEYEDKRRKDGDGS